MMFGMYGILVLDYDMFVRDVWSMLYPKAALMSNYLWMNYSHIFKFY
jgi:hypothetical protein